MSRPKLFPPLYLSAVLPACRLRLEVMRVEGRRPSATQQAGWTPWLPNGNRQLCPALGAAWGSFQMKDDLKRITIILLGGDNSMKI